MRVLFGILIVILTLGSCNVRFTGVKKGDNIEASDRQDIKRKVDSIITAFGNHDASYPKSIILGSLKEKANVFDTLVLLDVIKKKSVFRSLDEFYISNDITRRINMVESKLEGFQYNFFFQPMSMNTYVVLYSIYNQGEEFNTLLSIVFEREDDDWKIQMFHFSPYAYKGKSGPEFAILANQEMLKDNLTTAYLYANVASVLAQPATNNLHYKVEPELSKQYNNIVNAYKQQFPMPRILTEIQSKPKITDVLPLISRTKISTTPNIKYESRIEENETALLNEAKKLHEYLLNNIHDLKAISDSIVYDVTYIKNNVGVVKTISLPVDNKYN